MVVEISVVQNRKGLLNANYLNGFTHFKRLHKCPQQNPDCVALPQKLH